MDGPSVGRIFILLILLAGLSRGVLAEGPSVSPLPANARVSRGQFTHAISGREPVDEVAILKNSERSIYYFSELIGLQGRTVTHRWEYQGRVVSEVRFQVGGPRWRVFSHKTLDPRMTGRWSLVVVDESGWPLYVSRFDYREAEAEE